jgi:3-hydroxyisobutyrate dehydrogenase-like beta-hydroxyacid dehydrogenase
MAQADRTMIKVGFIGIGRMGSGIAGNVLRAADDLVVYNRTREKTAELAAAGAHVAPTLAAACEERDVVMTILADDAALNEVTLGSGGLRDSLPPGSIHVVMGTHGVGTVRALADAHREAGQVLVAAHVLGRADVAAAGTLGVITAGPPEAVEFCQPLFEAIGRRTFDAGTAPEAATALKLANNFLLGCAIEVMGEAFSLARSYEVPGEVLYEMMVDGLFSAPAYKVYGRIMADEAYDSVGFTADLGLKDANLILAAADLARLPLPSASVWRDRLLGAIAHGDGAKDWAVVALEQARAAGLSP